MPIPSLTVHDAAGAKAPSGNHGKKSFSDFFSGKGMSGSSAK